LFSVLLGRQAEKFVKRTEPKLRERLRQLFIVLKLEPVPAAKYDARKVRGAIDTYRIRISSYRVVYTVEWDEKRIRVFEIERRDEHTYD